MRRRTWPTAACLILLALPSLPVAAADRLLSGPATQRVSSSSRNMAVERSQLRALMLQRHQLITGLVALNGARGQPLTLAALSTADAVLSGDAAALGHALAEAIRHQTRRTPARHGIGTVLMPAAPGALWSPAARPLDPGTLAWDPAVATMPQSPLAQGVASPPALSTAPLTSWAGLLPGASRWHTALPDRPSSPTAPPPTERANSTSARATGPVMLPDAVVVTYTAQMEDPAYSAPVHGSLTVDGGSGAAPIAAANATVAAALLTPALATTGTVTATAPVTASQIAVPVVQPPDITALRRRREAVLAALAQVRALQAWASANAPAQAITPDAVITSPAMLDQQLDHWTAAVPITVTSPPGSAIAPPDAANSPPQTALPSATPTTGIGPKISAHILHGLEGPLAGDIPVALATASPAVHRASGSTGQTYAIPVVSVGATLELSGSVNGDPTSGVSISALLSRDRAGASAISSIADLTGTQAAASEVGVPLTLSPVTAPTVAMTGTDGLSATTMAASTGDMTSTAGPGADATGTAASTTPGTAATVAPAGTATDTTTTTSTALAGTTGTLATTSTPGTGSADIGAATGTAAAMGTGTATGTVTTSGATGTAAPDIATGTPPAGGIVASPSPDSSATGLMDTTATATAPLSASAPLTPSLPLTITVPSTASLDLAIDGASPVLTITTGLSATPDLSAASGTASAVNGNTVPPPTADVSTTTSLSPTVDQSATAPFTLVVTMPATAAQTLQPGAFARQRGALESVLRQGAALFARLQASQDAAEASYRAQLNAVVSLNSYLERRWLARFNAYVYYLHAYPAWNRRVAVFNAYAHALHASALAHEQWQQRMAAWTKYAQEMAAYKAALAAQQHVPIIPISGTMSAPGPTSLPPKPVMPPFPGPEPPPFTALPPPWPGPAPIYVAPPGPEPIGYALPLPPEPIPQWDGAALPVSVITTGGTSPAIGAYGQEETTQAALIADGALDSVPSYQDPVKGIITTYWGGRTIFQSFHPGIDIAAPMYTPIHAAAAGVVVFAGYAVPGQRHESYGLCVIIRHNSVISTLYAHMDDQTYGLQVRAGDTVQQGQVIGYIGMTGWTTGPHLHFEMRENNVQFNPLLLIPDPQS